MTDDLAGFDPDDETRRILHASDPVPALPPLDPDRLDALLEDTMSETHNKPEQRRRPLRLAGLAAAAAVVIAGAAFAAASLGDDSKDEQPAAKQTVTELAVAGATAAKCAAPQLSDAAAMQVAFEGTVTGIKDGVVTLEPSHFYTSPATDLVTVNEPDLETSEMPVDFQVGEDYIVGATDGFVSICGLAGPATDELRAFYDEAFAQ